MRSSSTSSSVRILSATNQPSQVLAEELRNLIEGNPDVMPGPNLDTESDWATLVLVLQSELNYWMPLEAIDLRKLPQGPWTRVKLDIKEERLLRRICGRLINPHPYPCPYPKGRKIGCGCG